MKSADANEAEKSMPAKISAKICRTTFDSQIETDGFRQCDEMKK